MSLKLLAVILVILAVPLPCWSSPLASPGDRVLRQDVQLLRGYGVIQGPVDAWPLSWAQLGDSLTARTPDDRLPKHAEAAARRLLGERPPADVVRLQSVAAFTNQRSLIFGFNGGARNDVDLNVSAQRTWSRATTRLTMGYRSGDGSDTIVLDGSYLSLNLGNWILYGGALDRWYGPGWDAGLVLSRNARPVPGVGFFRSVPSRSKPGILRWMGPWRFDAFVGLLGGDRSDFAHPLNMNLRLSLQPLSRFDIAISRGFMLCGKGRPCGPEEWIRSLVATFDLDNPGTDEDPSNQNASLAVSYTFLPGAVQLTPILEWYFEDEFDFMSILLGTRLLVPAGEGTWRFQLEYSDTYANRILGILDSSWWVPTPGKTYHHFIYNDGYTHRGEVIGHPMGGDGRLVTVEAAIVGRSGWSLVSRLRHVDIRIDPLSESEPIFRETTVVELGSEFALGESRVGVNVRWMEEDPFATERNLNVWEVEAAYRARIDVGP